MVVGIESSNSSKLTKNWPFAKDYFGYIQIGQKFVSIDGLFYKGDEQREFMWRDACL